jgi:hypothetical protein
MQASPPALQVLLRKMAFALNNLRSDVKTMMAENARNQQERGTRPRLRVPRGSMALKLKGIVVAGFNGLVIDKNLVVLLTSEDDRRDIFLLHSCMGPSQEEEE